MPLYSAIRRFLGPLRSRKVRVALATILSAALAEYGLEASEEMTLAIVGIGATLILGIAHEDAGRNAASSHHPAEFGGETPKRGPA